MEKIKLKRGTIWILLQSKKIGALGTATMKSMKAKLDLAKNIKNMVVINNETQESINDLIRQLGEVDSDGNISIPEKINESPNPKLQEFIIKRQELFDIEEDIEIRKIKVEEFLKPDELDVNDLTIIADIMIID
jgi:hypothetical protein